MWLGILCYGKIAIALGSAKGGAELGCNALQNWGARLAALFSIQSAKYSQFFWKYFHISSYMPFWKCFHQVGIWERKMKIYAFAKFLGPAGFVLANCCNFAMRIFYNCRHIQNRHRSQKETPLMGIIPSCNFIIVLVTCGIACKWSELNLYNNFSSYEGAFYHLLTGVICFVITNLCILWNEDFIKEPALNFVRKYTRRV